MKSAANMRLKKLIVATPVSDARTIRSWAMNLTPAVTAPFPSSAGGSAGRIRPRKNAEPRNDSASAMTANGAVHTCTSRPPMLDRPTYARAPHIRQRPPSVDQRLPVHVPFRRDDRHEQRRVRHVEQDGQRPG